MIFPLILVFGAGGVGLWVRARAKKKNMLGKVPGEPKLPGGYVTFRRGPYLIFIEKADSPPDVEPPFTWGVIPYDAVKAAAGGTDAEKATTAAKAGALLIAHGANDYAQAVLWSQVWTQGLLGNVPAAPKPGEYVIFGRGKGALTIIVGQAAKADAQGHTIEPYQPAVPPLFRWGLLSSSAIRAVLSAESAMSAPLGEGDAGSYVDAVKAAEAKVNGMQGMWAHLPPYGAPLPITFKKKKRGWS